MQRALAALALALVLPLPSLANVTVKPGDTLGEIAERHGVSVNRLMQANGIKDPNQLQIGQRLVIPGRSAAAASGGGSSGARAAGGSVVVRPGDTLSEIAVRHGVSLQRLMQLNGISNPAMVEAGRRLVLSSGGSPASSSSRGDANANYTVRSGDTLGDIAERHNTSVNRLMQLNGISDPTQLQAGSRIAVPGSVSRRPEATASSGRPLRATTTREHVVRPGESLSEIADAYNLPLQKLVALNNIDDPNLLMSGTRLKLTAPPPVPAARPAPKRPAAAAAKPQPRPRPAAKPAAKPAPAVAAKPKPAATSAAPTAPEATAPEATTPQPTSPRTTASQAAPAQTAAPQATTTQATAPQTAAPQTAKASNTTASKATASSATATKATASNTTASTTAAPATTTSATPTKAAATSTAPARQPRVATAAPATKAAAKPADPDWRSYGPLQVDWANWQPMGGSFVAPSLNAEGQPLYTAINCGARKLNATSQAGQWRTWEAPSTDAEQQLVRDLCKAKGS